MAAKADNAMANHFHGPAEEGLDLPCETALQAHFIQHAKHQTWGILLLSWERSLSVLILYCRDWLATQRYFLSGHFSLFCR